MYAEDNLSTEHHDMWSSSRNCLSRMSMVLHFMENWGTKSARLHTSFPTEHTGEDTASWTLDPMGSGATVTLWEHSCSSVLASKILNGFWLKKKSQKKRREKKKTGCLFLCSVFNYLICMETNETNIRFVFIFLPFIHDLKIRFLTSCPLKE